MEDIIDFLVALAAGEFDAKHLYGRGYPYLYDIEFFERRRAVLLQMQGKIPLSDGYLTGLSVIISPKFYNTGKTYIPEYEIDPVLEKIFLGERMNLADLEIRFNSAFSCETNRPPLLRRLFELEIDIGYGTVPTDGFLVAAKPPSEESSFIGASLLEYSKSDEEREQTKPVLIGDLVSI